MSLVRIATYNTSFASDLGKVDGFESEKHFLYRALKLSNTRQFFENSIQHAIEWCETPGADGAPWGAIGFQEMNTPEKYPKYFDFDNSPEKQHDDRGINYTIDRFINEFGDNVRAVSGAVTYDWGAPTVLTIWNTVVFGELKGSKTPGAVAKYSYKTQLPKYVYVSEMETESIIREYPEQLDIKKKLLGPDLKPQAGRPILIVLTEREDKDYLLINLHGPNRSPANDEMQMKLNHFCIQSHIEAALRKFDLGVIPPNTFIMGDFNGVFEDKNFTFKGKTFSAVKGSDKLPLSCCYNFNSSCPENMRSGVFRKIFNVSRGKINTINNSAFNKLKITRGLQYLIGTNEAHASDFAKDILSSSNFEKRVVSDIGQFIKQFTNPEGTPEGQGEKFEPKQDLFQVSSVDPECVIVRSLDKSRDQFKGDKRDLGDRGKIVNYALPGDFVLGPEGTVVKSAKIVKGKGEKDGVSERSDHEMVSVTFKLVQEGGGAATGGRRVKRGRTKKNRVNTSKKSKRNNLNK